MQEDFDPEEQIYRTSIEVFKDVLDNLGYYGSKIKPVLKQTFGDATEIDILCPYPEFVRISKFEQDFRDLPTDEKSFFDDDEITLKDILSEKHLYEELLKKYGASVIVTVRIDESSLLIPNSTQLILNAIKNSINSVLGAYHNFSISVKNQDLTLIPLAQAEYYDPRFNSEYRIIISNRP